MTATTFFLLTDSPNPSATHSIPPAEYILIQLSNAHRRTSAYDGRRQDKVYAPNTFGTRHMNNNSTTKVQTRMITTTNGLRVPIPDYSCEEIVRSKIIFPLQYCEK